MAVTREAGLLACVVIATIAASVLIASAVIDDQPAPSQLPVGVQLAYKAFIVPAGGTARGEAVCPAGQVVTGGGPYTNAVNSTLLLLDSFPLPVSGSRGQPHAWVVRFRSKALTEVGAGVVAVCVTTRSPSRPPSPTRPPAPGATTRPGAPPTTPGATSTVPPPTRTGRR